MMARRAALAVSGLSVVVSAACAPAATPHAPASASSTAPPAATTAAVSPAGAARRETTTGEVFVTTLLEDGQSLGASFLAQADGDPTERLRECHMATVRMVPQQAGFLLARVEMTSNKVTSTVVEDASPLSDTLVACVTRALNTLRVSGPPYFPRLFVYIRFS